jgi:hypothetical protein
MVRGEIKLRNFVVGFSPHLPEIVSLFDIAHNPGRHVVPLHTSQRSVEPDALARLVQGRNVLEFRHIGGRTTGQIKALQPHPSPSPLLLLATLSVCFCCWLSVA